MCFEENVFFFSSGSFFFFFFFFNYALAVSAFFFRGLLVFNVLDVAYSNRFQLLKFKSAEGVYVPIKEAL